MPAMKTINNSLTACLLILPLKRHVCCILQSHLGNHGAPAEGGSSPAPGEAAAEAGAVQPVQLPGAGPATVHVCPAGPLASLHLVCHRQGGDG